ncbi:MAG: M64 family metallopeptidase [Verrucomicrobiota bacterium]|jgi:hypothetical protein
MKRRLRSPPLLAALGLLLLAGGWPRAHGQPAMTTLLTNGPVANRLNVVMLAEGYTSNQLGQFLIDATNAVNALLSHQPYQEYRGYFNAFAISVASRQSGSSHPVEGTKLDTYFGTTYDQADYLITLPPSGQAKVDALLKNSLPQCHLPVLLVNDPVSGGSDGFNRTAIASTGALAAEILTHETGHVLANLGDEYTNAYPGFPNIEEPNTTRETRRGYIKWKAWIAADTPLPTPPTADYTEVIGLFQGAHYHATGWYRPKFDCAMNHVGVPFCEVCSEALVRALYQKVRPVDSFTPANTNLWLSPTQAAVFSLNVLQPATHNLSVQWFADGLGVSGATNLLFTGLPTLGPGGHLISALVQDNTTLVRTDPAGLLSQVLTWTVEGGFSNAVQNASISLRAYIQGAVSPNGSTVFRAAITTRDIIKALDQAAPNATFSPGAKLLLVTPSNAAASRFVVRDKLNGTNRDTDVSSYFTNSLVAAVTRSSGSGAGRTTGTEYAVEGLVLNSDSLRLSLQGLASITWPGAAATASVLGSGAVTSAPAVFQGTVTLSPGKSERPAR